MVYNWVYTRKSAPLSDDDRLERAIGNGPEHVDQTTFRSKANRDNAYLIDRAVQKTETFTGIDGINVQDRAIQESMGEVRRAVRDDLAVNIDQCDGTVIATTDPTGSRQLHELEMAIGQLPEEQRQVLLLVGLEGMSYEDTAAGLRIPIGTFRSRLSRARNFLRNLMGIQKLPTKVGRQHRGTERPAIAA